MIEEENIPSGNEPFDVKGASHERILKIMGLLVLAGSIVSATLVSLRFGAGVLLGGFFSVLNYHWLRVTLKKFFDRAVEGGNGGLIAVRFVSRYLLLGAILVLVYMTGIVPVIAVLFGLAGFAFAVVAEGILSIFGSAKAR